MPEQRHPFRSNAFAIGAARDGQTLELRAMTAAAADELAAKTAAIGPWAHYASEAASISAVLQNTADGSVGYEVRSGAALAGAVVVCCPWLAGPYLQLLAILPAHQNRGIGGSVLAWFEAEARDHYRNLWLCVSAFNVAAQRFYERHGFERVATLAGLLREGDDELLMRKRLAR
jgi:ribosomal protein S18 acetylase RimI-like enzyme